MRLKSVTYGEIGYYLELATTDEIWPNKDVKIGAKTRKMQVNPLM